MGSNLQNLPCLYGWSVAAWKEHEEKLDAKAAILKKNNSQNYTTLHQEQT